MNVVYLTSVSSKKNRKDRILLFSLASVQVHVEERESHSGLLLTSDGVTAHPAEGSNRIILNIRNENCLRSTPANKRVEF